MQSSSDSAGDDPLNLEAVDREIRINKLRAQIEQTTGQPFVPNELSDRDPKVEEAFLEQVLELESHGFVCPLEVLQGDGFELPTADQLDDANLSTRLWELIRELARRRLFLYSTDHLGDRELYEWLLNEGLREELMGFGLPYGNCHLDLLGSGSEEDVILQMRYYADEKERAEWAAEFPDFPMPAMEKRPFDRDRLLPKAYPDA